MWKVIIVDNFNREWISDRPYKYNLSKEEAEKLAKEMNSSGGMNSPDYYKAVENDYTLHDAYADLP